MKLFRSDKKTDKAQAPLSVLPELDLITNKAPAFKSGAVQYILIILLTMSSIVTGMSFIDIDPSLSSVTIVCVILTSAVFFKPICALAGYVLFGLFSVINYKSIAGGTLVIVREFLIVFKSYTKASQIDSTVQSLLTVSEDSAATLALTVLAAVMVLLLYLSVFRFTNFITVFLITFPLPELGLYQGLVPNYLAAFILVTSWVCVFCMQANDFGRRDSRKKSSPSFIKSKLRDSFFMISKGFKSAAFAQICIQTATLASAAVILAFCAIHISGYQRSDDLNILRRELAYDFSYNGLKKAISEISDSGQESDDPEYGGAAVSGGMSMGVLGNAYDLEYSGVKLLEFETSCRQNDSIYLRGYCADCYRNNRWVTSGRLNEYIEKTNRLLSDINYSDYDIDVNTSSLFQTGRSIMGHPVVDYEFGFANINNLTNSTTRFSPYYVLGFYGDIKISGAEYMDTLDGSYATDYIAVQSHSDSISIDAGKMQGFSLGYFLYRMSLYQGDCEKAFSDAPLFSGKYPLLTQEDMLYTLCEYMSSLNSGSSYSIITISESSEASLSEKYNILEYDGALTQTLSLEEFFAKAHDYLLSIGFVGYSDFEAYAAADCAYANFLDVEVNIDQSLLCIGEPEQIMGIYGSNLYKSDIGEYTALVVSKIKGYFESNYSYSLSVEKTPDDSDFIEYFLYEMDAGSCTYFSSAAVQLLRSYGIPARYVEGFMLPYEDFKNKEQSGNGLYHYDVYDKYAHAWVEIYLPSIGWVPVDFTVSGSRSAVTTRERNTSTASASTTSQKQTVSTTSSAKSKTVTTPAKQTSTDTKSKQTKGEGSGSALKTLLTVFLAVGAAALAAGGYCRIRVSILKGREKSIHGEDESENAINCYSLILKYLKLIGIGTNENLSDIERCRLLCGQLKAAGFEQALCDRLTSAAKAAVSAKMGGEFFDEKDTEPIRELLYDVKALCFEKLSVTERFISKYIKMLY